MATASLPTLVSSGAPANGVDEVQALTTSGTVTAGVFRVSHQGFITGPISWTATTAILETALNTLPNIAAGGTASVGVAVTSGPFPGTALVITFSGTQVAKRAHGLITLHANDLVGGGTVIVTEATAGVTVFGIGAAPGAQAINGVDGTLYYNAGNANLPNWVAV
jgi:hypothetical protein